MYAKYKNVVEYVSLLEIGSKISVRSIASILGVSDGTAYRGIKQCESLGIVSIIPRIGTIRIKKVEKKRVGELTYAKLINIIDGILLGGKKGIYKTLNNFVIGAMTTDAMKKYITPGSLLIVGNREEAQRLALLNNSAVLITGGFNCSDNIKKLANEKCLPVISSKYDTFTIASIINKTISENLIKKDILLVEDIMNSSPYYFKCNDKIEDLKKISNSNKQKYYPVVDYKKKLVGIVTLKDIVSELSSDDTIKNIMTKDPISVTPKTTVAYASHIMARESIKFCPVVYEKKLVGIIFMKDIIKALKYVNKRPQVGRTIEDLILSNFNFKSKDGKMYFFGEIIPEMLDRLGTASWSSLNMMLSTMGIKTLKHKNNLNISVDNIVTYFMKPVQMNRTIEIYTEIVDMARNFCKVEVNMFNYRKELIAKSMISAKILK